MINFQQAHYLFHKPHVHDVKEIDEELQVEQLEEVMATRDHWHYH